LNNETQNKIYIEKISELFNLAYDNDKIKSKNLNFCSNMEAETIKYFRNCFLATKVSFCNEMEEFCRIKKINYENVRSLSVLDPRIGSSHSFVPGHDGNRGFGGTCFPKDTSALLYEMNSIGMNSFVIKSIVERNQQVDRPSKDWNSNVGRCVIDDK
jgi:UDPglucose 6-dehydrogenase